MKMDRKVIRNFGLITQLGVVIVVTILGSIFLGIWLDKVFNTNIIFTIIFIVLGVGAAFRNLLKITMMSTTKNREDKDEDRKDNN